MLGMAPTGLWCAASLVQVLCEAPACLVWPPAACKDGPAADCWGTLARCALWLCPFLTGGCAPWPEQVKEYYGEYNTLERGEGAVMRESKKVRGLGLGLPPWPAHVVWPTWWTGSTPWSPAVDCPAGQTCKHLHAS